MHPALLDLSLFPAAQVGREHPIRRVADEISHALPGRAIQLCSSCQISRLADLSGAVVAM